MKLKRIFACALAAATLLATAACGAADPAPTTDEQTPAAEQKPVILAVSFGTSYNDNRDLSIGAVEEALQTAFPDYEVRRAFTSQTIIDILAERDDLDIDNVTEAMDRLVADGVTDVVIQPTHVMAGYEYDDVMAEIASYEDQFDSFKVGVPLLSTDADADQLVAILAEETAEYNTEDTAIVFMGHGTEHDANAAYSALQQWFVDAGYDNYFIGTVEATPSLDDVLAQVQATDATKVVLLPLMIVAGDHANNDMAGDEDDSWKTTFTNAGYEVQCVLKGLGQYEGVQQMIVAHAQAAIDAE